LEGTLLLGLAITTPCRHREETALRRAVAIGLVTLVSATNLVSLGLLSHFLLKGGKANGHALILAGIVIWLTNVLIHLSPAVVLGARPRRAGDAVAS